jgi:hypothetical protein
MWFQGDTFNVVQHLCFGTDLVSNSCFRMKQFYQMTGYPFMMRGPTPRRGALSQQTNMARQASWFSRRKQIRRYARNDKTVGAGCALSLSWFSLFSRWRRAVASRGLEAVCPLRAKSLERMGSRLEVPNITNTPRSLTKTR